MLPFLDAVSRLLHDHGYTLNPKGIADACARRPDEVCALLAAAGTVAATCAQITILTGAADALAGAHTTGRPDLPLREQLDRVADALTAALARNDKATAALHRGCKSLIHAGSDLVSTPDHTTDPIGLTDRDPRH
ncbi:hypothetical protein [Micromonospora sp. NPDC050495]|uniref:hypothetical protein n=1 Tax=Micromonospora sp. NPDC050495 TaxID=3154936 RepID=UPI0033D5DFFD